MATKVHLLTVRKFLGKTADGRESSGTSSPENFNFKLQKIQQQQLQSMNGQVEKLFVLLIRQLS
jgi:hypothetical protein